MAGHITPRQPRSGGGDQERFAPASGADERLVSKAPTPTEWRAAMGYFPSGVTIVTTWQGDQPVGSTVSSFCSVSLEPPLLLVCLNRVNPIRAPIEQCGVFGVNILHQESGRLARQFSVDPDADRFGAISYRRNGGGAPQLADAPVFIDCLVESMHRAGDHLIVVGRGAWIEHTSATPPLLYHKGAFLKLPPPA